MSVRVEAESRAERARAFLKSHPNNADALRALGAALRVLGNAKEAERAELDAIMVSTRDPLLIEAATALLDNNVPIAEHLLRARLKDKPTDVAAIRMFAELASRVGHFSDAENLLRRAIELAPGFLVLRSNLAIVLYKQGRSEEAVAMLDALLEDNPENNMHNNLKAAALGRIGSYEEAMELYREVLNRRPRQPKVWMSLGHVLKTVGRQQDAIDAYRHALEINAGLGEVWWSLANLKTVRFDDSDVATMTTELERPDLADDDRFHLHFALGKALEDAGNAELSFRHYDAGNRLRRTLIDYDPQETVRHVAASKSLFTPALLAEAGGKGCEAREPIFIVGMPRAGSTLIEQILASHSAVEGTMELPDIPVLVARLRARKGGVSEVPADELRSLGEEYLERTRIQRKTDRPFFIDKLPNNWAHVGYIHLMLPNARIIDARRHPLGCCFSNFKQHFARGQAFTYSLEDVGRYYAGYVELMAHFDRVLPGRVRRVIYERMVDDTEAEIRSLLDDLGLPFEPACLRYWETERAVRTASSEQVRRPIFRESTDQWRAFEPWLGPLKTALGPVLEQYPDVPAEFLLQ